MPSKNDILFAVVGVGALGYFLWRQQREYVLEDVSPGSLRPEILYDYGDDVDLADVDIQMGNSDMYTDEQKLAAFLFMIRASENTLPSARNGTAYNTFYGGSFFKDTSDHPVLTGEKTGVVLSDEMCRAAGFSSGCVSTAAGAYQIIRPTWNDFRVGGSWGPRLEDFSPASQDEAVRRILLRDGALALLLRGDFTGALRIASKRWASLPGSKAQQNPKSIEYAVARYDEGLNTFA